MSEEPCKSCGGKGWFQLDERTGDDCGRCETTGVEPRYRVFADGTTIKTIRGVTRAPVGDPEPF